MEPGFSKTPAWVIACVFLASALFVANLIAMRSGLLAPADEAVLQWFRVADNPGEVIGPDWFEEAAGEVTALGSYTIVIIVCLVSVGTLLSYRLFSAAAFIVLAVAGGTLISSLLKLIIERPRPEIVEHLDRTFTYSFPSGHALMSSVAYLTLAAVAVRFIERRRTRRFLISSALTLAALVGVSRIYLGVHWPSDVFAGWCLGSGWAGLCWLAAHWLSRRNSRVESAPNLGRSHL